MQSLRWIILSLPAILLTGDTLAEPTAKPRAKAPSREVDHSTLQWRIGKPVILDSIEELGPFARTTRRLAPNPGTKLVGVPITWTVPKNTPEADCLVLGNLYFTAHRQGKVPRSGAAFALGDCGEQVLWFIPNAGEGKTLALDDLSTVVEHTVSVAFVVPADWDSFNVRYAIPVGEVKLNAQAGADPKTQK